MSRLFFAGEKGHVIPGLCEELTCYRHAQKEIVLPATQQDAELYILARPHPHTPYSLHVSVNDIELSPIRPNHLEMYSWYRANLAPGQLKAGVNRFEFWTDSHAMDAWSLAMQIGGQPSGSCLSNDSGQTWQSQHMGYLNLAGGEYVVRIRLAEGQDNDPPAWIAEDPSNPRLIHLRGLLPADVTQAASSLACIQALSSWVSTRWVYRCSADAAQYTPWDPETILAWGQSQKGHNGQIPIVMCVHYAVFFVMACQALGLPARAAVFTEEINGINGHYVAEVWMSEYGKWVYVDPNVDAMFFREGVPLSVAEIKALVPDLEPYIHWGPGRDFHKSSPIIMDFLSRYTRGGFLNRRSIWSRADFLSHPELTPPGHGALAYCETDLIWEKSDQDEGCPMFPYFGTPAYFDKAPTGA